MAIYITTAPSTASSSGIPIIVTTSVTYTVPTNTQVSYTTPITVQAGGIVLTAGTGTLTFFK